MVAKDDILAWQPGQEVRLAELTGPAPDSILDLPRRRHGMWSTVESASLPFAAGQAQGPGGAVQWDAGRLISTRLVAGLLECNESKTSRVKQKLEEDGKGTLNVDAAKLRLPPGTRFKHSGALHAAWLTLGQRTSRTTRRSAAAPSQAACGRDWAGFSLPVLFVFIFPFA